jgi:hypothetical protein
MAAMAEAPTRSEKTVNNDFHIFISGTVMDKAGIHNREFVSIRIAILAGRWRRKIGVASGSRRWNAPANW